MQPLLRNEIAVLKSTPNLSDQQRFWNYWNASQRDPGRLKQRTLNRGEAIIALVRSLGLDNPKILDFGCGTG
jgi:hypothetical protein